MGENLHGFEVGIDFLNKIQMPLPLKDFPKSKNNCTSKDTLMKTVKTPATDWEKNTQF